MEDGYLLKCILVVLVFFGPACLVKIIVGVHAKWRSVWGHALELALQVGPQLRKLTIGKPPPRPPRDGCSTDSKKYGVRWKSCWWRVPYSGM